MANKLLKELTMDEVTYDVPVLGIKGKQESNYRQGDVNLTLENLAYLGSNVIADTTADTQTNWKALGTGYCYFSQQRTNGQPTSSGWVVSRVQGNVITQTYYTATSGVIYRRGATTAGADMPEWVSVRDGLAPLASPTFTGTPKAPSVTDKSDKTTQIANTAFVQGAIDRRLPKATKTFKSSSTAIATTNNTVKEFDVWTADAAGTIIATGAVVFAANATGRRSFEIEVGGRGIGSGQQVTASSNGNTMLSTTIVRHLTSGQKVNFAVAQQSGGALNVSSHYLIGIWIPD